MANPFTYANIVARCPSDWSKTGTITDSSQTIYISGCSWVIQARVSSVALRSNWVNITAYYYNGSTWVQAYAPRGNNGYTVYKKGAGSQSLKFYHMRPTEGTTEGDHPYCHLWKIVVQMRGKDGSAHGYFDWYVGGIEKMSEAWYNTYFRYKPIKCIPIDVQSNYGDDAFVANYRPSNWTGVPIGGVLVTLCGYSQFD